MVGEWGVKGKKKKPTDLPQRRSARLAAREDGPSFPIPLEPDPDLSPPLHCPAPFQHTAVPFLS
jgi:hypothetical protein